MKYPILIPSRGRPHNCDTINNIPAEFHDNIWLFVLESEADSYQWTNERMWGNKVHIVCASASTDKISEKREKMVKYMSEKLGMTNFWMMDDDLKFFTRRNEYVGDTRLRIISTADEFRAMWDCAEEMVEIPGRYCAIGISLRQGNNNLKFEGDSNTRLIRCGLYNTWAFLNAEHSRLRYMGDFDVMLQMLKMGLDNHVIAQYSQDHVGTNAKGGCSAERDEAAMEESANGLAAMHKDCVVTKQKVNKGGKLAVRTDVTIYWKKARKSGF